MFLIASNLSLDGWIPSCVMIKPASRKTMVSKRNNIEVTYHKARHRRGKYNASCIQTYGRKKKLAILMIPSLQGSLQRTKTLILKAGNRFTWICRSALRRRVC